MKCFCFARAVSDLMMGTDALSSRCLEWLCFYIAATPIINEALTLNCQRAKWYLIPLYLEDRKAGRRWQSRIHCNPALFICSLTTTTSEGQCLKYIRPERWLPQNHLPHILTVYCLHQECSLQQILHPLACPISSTTALRENGCCVVTSQEERTRNTPGSMDQVSTIQNVVIIPHFSTCLYCHSLSLLLFGAFPRPRRADLTY